MPVLTVVTRITAREAIPVAIPVAIPISVTVAVPITVAIPVPIIPIAGPVATATATATPASAAAARTTSAFAVVRRRRAIGACVTIGGCDSVLVVGRGGVIVRQPVSLKAWELGSVS